MGHLFSNTDDRAARSWKRRSPRRWARIENSGASNGCHLGANSGFHQRCALANPLIVPRGEVAERIKAAVLKTARGCKLPRVFESHPLRQLSDLKDKYTRLQT